MSRQPNNQQAGQGHCNRSQPGSPYTEECIQWGAHIKSATGPKTDNEDRNEGDNRDLFPSWQVGQHLKEGDTGQDHAAPVCKAEKQGKSGIEPTVYVDNKSLIAIVSPELVMQWQWLEQERGEHHGQIEFHQPARGHSFLAPVQDEKYRRREIEHKNKDQIKGNGTPDRGIARDGIDLG